MINSVTSNVNNIQYLRATQAFKSAMANNQKANNLVDNSIEDTASIDNSSNIKNTKVAQSTDSVLIQKKEYINEFKDYLKDYKKLDINDTEIKDALKYGDSILIDQIA